MVREGKNYRLVKDALGSVRLVVDSVSGEVKQRMDYDVWGNVTSDTAAGFQPFGFAGGLLDSDTGLTRFGARDYEAASGRWTAKDPLRFGGGDANLYAYVGNSPVNFVDPTGLWTVGIGGQAELQLLIGFDVSAQIVIDGDGNIGLALTADYRQGLMVAAGASGTASYNWDARTIQDLQGGGVGVGVGVGPFAVSYQASYQGKKSNTCEPGENDNEFASGAQLSAIGLDEAYGVSANIGYTAVYTSPWNWRELVKKLGF
jgi:RHS repeat-associated protein